MGKFFGKIDYLIWNYRIYKMENLLEIKSRNLKESENSFYISNVYTFLINLSYEGYYLAGSAVSNMIEGNGSFDYNFYVNDSKDYAVTFMEILTKLGNYKTIFKILEYDIHKSMISIKIGFGINIIKFNIINTQNEIWETISNFDLEYERCCYNRKIFCTKEALISIFTKTIHNYFPKRLDFDKLLLIAKDGYTFDEEVKEHLSNNLEKKETYIKFNITNPENVNQTLSEIKNTYNENTTADFLFTLKPSSTLFDYINSIIILNPQSQKNLIIINPNDKNFSPESTINSNNLELVEKNIDLNLKNNKRILKNDKLELKKNKKLSKSDNNFKVESVLNLEKMNLELNEKVSEDEKNMRSQNNERILEGNNNLELINNYKIATLSVDLISYELVNYNKIYNHVLNNDCNEILKPFLTYFGKYSKYISYYKSTKNLKKYLNGLEIIFNRNTILIMPLHKNINSEQKVTLKNKNDESIFEVYLKCGQILIFKQNIINIIHIETPTDNSSHINLVFYHHI